MIVGRERIPPPGAAVQLARTAITSATCDRHYVPSASALASSMPLLAVYEALQAFTNRTSALVTLLGVGRSARPPALR